MEKADIYVTFLFEVKLACFQVLAGGDRLCSSAAWGSRDVQSFAIPSQSQVWGV
jgi:hypothetical protein